MNNIKNTLKNLIFAILSSLATHYFPLSSHLLKITSDKLLSSIDLAIYITVLNILWELFFSCIDKNKMKVKASIVNKRQDNNKFILRPNDSMENHEVLLKLAITGRKKKSNLKIRVSYPNYFTVQLSRGMFDFAKITENCIELDLQTMINSSSSEINLHREIEFNLSLDQHNIGNKDTLKCLLDKCNINPLISFQSTELEIRQEGV